VASLIEERMVPTEELRIGMFVCRLDRPWEGTPFPLQGFTLQSEEQLETLRSLCRKVTIDEQKSLSLTAEPLDLLDHTPAMSSPRQVFGPWYGKVAYTDSASMMEELPRARLAQERLHAFIVEVLDDLRAGRNLAISAIREAVLPVIESLLRSADAVFWLNALRHRGTYEYSHALNCTSLAVAFGRHLGFPQDKLLKLATGGLLLDVGKAQLPIDVLLHPGPLDAEKLALMQRHVEYSLAILELSGERSFEVRAMVASHHERHDGSGYPKAEKESAIPIYGRIAGIVDAFDAMTSDRPYRAGIAHHDALQQLYRTRDRMFQSELVEQFIQCIGVYPTGSLVELSSGEVAIVMAQNRSRHLCPRVMVLTAPDKLLAEDFRELDLATLADGPEAGDSLRIVHTLEPGAYGLDPTELYL
jgi:HD-GYP domain-containing protein (c-di-GMP phosphodiesterase class II)